MMLRNDVTLLSFSAGNNDVLVYFFMSQVWTVKLTKSTNIFCISYRVACTIKLNIKEAFMGNDGFLQRFMW